MPATEILNGLVTGEFYNGVVDTSGDSDFDEDIIQSTGSGKMIPSVTSLAVDRVDGSTYRVQLNPVTFKVINGTPVNPDSNPLKLIANVGQFSGATPVGWYWTCKGLTLDGVGYLDFRVDVSPTVPADLSLLTPIPQADPSSTNIRGPRGYPGILGYSDVPPAGSPVLIFAGGQTSDGAPPNMRPNDYWFHS